MRFKKIANDAPLCLTSVLNILEIKFFKIMNQTKLFYLFILVAKGQHWEVWQVARACHLGKVPM